MGGRGRGVTAIMSTTWFDASFVTRIDPGRDMMRWPADIRDAVTYAVIQMRERNPRFGRVLNIVSKVDDNSEVIGFPYRVTVSLLVEQATVQ